MTLDEVIKQRLAEANLGEATKIEAKKPDAETVGVNKDEVVTEPKKKTLTKESLDEMTQAEFDALDVATLDEAEQAIVTGYTGKTKTVAVSEVTVAPAELAAPVVTKPSDDQKKAVSEQVSALLETEGLSEEFKTQAVTIFEAAVTDRVMQIEESLRKEFDSQLAEAKAEMDADIDGFLSEAVAAWTAKNEVAIKANFNSQLAESFVDGVKALMAEHNIELPADKENALEVALSEVDTLKESINGFDAEKLALVEQVNTLKAEKILGSFSEKMTTTEFDRFTQLTESVKFVDEEQYAKQLNVVLENFGSNKKIVAPVVETTVVPDVALVTETNGDVSQYAAYISKQVR